MKITTLAGIGMMTAGFIALGLAGATAAQATGLPAVGQDDYYTMPQGGTLTIAAPGILANDTDPENDPLYVGNDFNYQAADYIKVNADGSFTFTPDPSYYGQGGFNYYPADYTSLGSETAVHITITPTAPVQVVAPIANNDTYSTPMDTTLTVPAASGILANDIGPALVWNVNGLGTDVVVQQDGSFVYTPVAGFVGTKVLVYTSANGALKSNEATVTITVTGSVPPVVQPPVAAPVANPDAYSTMQDTVLTVPAAGLLSNDVVPAGSVIETDDLTGEIVAQADGSFVYTPAAGFAGLKELAYRIKAGTVFSAWAYVGITVTAAPVAPVDPTPADPTPGDPTTPTISTIPGDPIDSDLPTLALTGTDDKSTWMALPGVALVALGALGLWTSRRRAQLS